MAFNNFHFRLMREARLCNDTEVPKPSEASQTAEAPPRTPEATDPVKDGETTDTADKATQNAVGQRGAVIDTATTGPTSPPAVNELGLKQSPDGSHFTREGYTGKFFTQANGSVYWEGGTYSGINMGPRTYINGEWDERKSSPLTAAAEEPAVAAPEAPQPASPATPEAPATSPAAAPESNGTLRPATKEEMDASVAAEVAKMSPIKQQAFEKFMKLPTSPSAALTIAFFVGKMPEGALQASANGTQLSPQDLTQVADVVTSLTGPEFNFLKTLPLLPLDYGTPENPIDLQKTQTPEGYASLLREAAQRAPESGDPNADRVNKAITNLTNSLRTVPAKIGNCLAAIAELLASIKAIFKPEAAKGKDQPPAGPKAPGENDPGTPPVNGEKPPETNGEQEPEQKDRLRTEVQEAGSVQKFKEGKEQQKQDLEGTIQKEEDEVQRLDDVNDGMERQVRTLERTIPTGDKLTPDQQKQKTQLEDQIRDLKVDIDANKLRIDNNKKDIQEHTDEQKGLSEDVQAVDDMIADAKKQVEDLTKSLKGLADSPDVTKIPGAQDLLKGISISVDENKMDIVITLSEGARELLKTMGGEGAALAKTILDIADNASKSPSSTPSAPDGGSKPPEAPPAPPKSKEKGDISPDQLKVSKGLARVASLFPGASNDRVMNSLQANGDAKAIASIIVEGLKTQKYPIYISKNGSLYAKEKVAGATVINAAIPLINVGDRLNPDTQIANNDFANFLMTSPEAAVRALGEYGINKEGLNPDTRGFLNSLATMYEQGARAAPQS